MRNCDWWHGQSSLLVCCSYRLAGQPAWVQILEYATKCSYRKSSLSGLDGSAARLALNVAASSSRNRIRRVGESAHLSVAPPGMPGKTVICPPTLTSSGRIGVPSSRLNGTFLPPLLTGLQPVLVSRFPSFGFRIIPPTSGAATATP